MLEHQQSQVSIEEIRAARARIEGLAIRTPMVRLNAGSASPEIYLKLENLQPIRSFKLRGAGNAINAADPDELKNGVFTASAGNMAQGVAWCAKQRNIPCSVVIPEHASNAKVAAIQRLGADIVKVPFDDWWHVMTTHEFDGLDGFFVHPVANRDVIAGNGTIGLEILEDLPDVDAVIVPYGGGGLSCGIASAMKGAGSAAIIYACEVETAAPLAASLKAGQPVEVEMAQTFIDGIGSPMLLPEMWPLASELLHGSLTVSVEETASAIRLLMQRNCVVAEGAGAVPVAAALNHEVKGKKIVCIVSGGNIDLEKVP
ncbi:MAG: threonine/serine dehydratase [Gammaproteobacteria bacterium]|nr:threonine/serine dehydratase [Gammaproteobacteria bacterium]